VIDIDEIRRSLAGAWQVFLGRPGALRTFDISSDGFWRSFRAIGLVAPLYALTAIADWRAAGSSAALPPDGSAFAAARAITLVLDWAALPALLAGLAGFLGIQRGYTAFVVVRNWSTVITILPFAAIAALDLLGLLPGDLVVIPSLAALGFALRFGYMAARATLGVTVDVAIGFVALDFLVSLALVMTVGRLFGVE
jgi:hypothetical protein